jgi:hypothetical protein
LFTFEEHLIDVVHKFESIYNIIAYNKKHPQVIYASFFNFEVVLNLSYMFASKI